MSVKKIATTVLFLCMCCFMTAQDTSNFEHTIQSEAFGKERKIRVFLPDRYHRDSTATYMVTYVLDAQSDSFWNMAKSNIGYLANNYCVIPMITVGIVSDNRGSEFSPPATALQDHFRNEVFPLIEKNYRTEPFRAVVGHSWGGNFIGSTIFSENRDLFDAYIGISPSFGDTDSYVVRKADSLLKLKTKFKKYLYLSHGNVGRREAEFGSYVAQIDSLLKKYPTPSIAWQPRLIERTDHWQIVIPSFNDGLVSMSRNYFADQEVMEQLSKKGADNLPAEITKFYQEKKKTFGYIHEPSSGYLNFVANDFRDLEKYQTAIALYEMAQEKSPDDVKVFVNISDTYDKLGNTAKAKQSFLRTQKLLEAQKENVSDSYYTNVSKWISEKLAEYK